MLTQNKRLITILLAVVLLLLVPFIAMQFSSEVSWKLADFAAAAILLTCTGLMCELVLRKVKKRKNRIILCAITCLMLLFTWLELAVGIFGTAFGGS